MASLAHQLPSGYGLQMNNNSIYSNPPQTSQANHQVMTLGSNNHFLFRNGSNDYLSNNRSYEQIVEIDGQHYLKVIQENLIPIQQHEYYPILDQFLNENSNDNCENSKFENHSIQFTGTRLVEDKSVTNFLLANDGNLFGNHQMNSNSDQQFDSFFLNSNFDNDLTELGFDNLVKNQNNSNEFNGSNFVDLNMVDPVANSLMLNASSDLKSSKKAKRKVNKPPSQAKPKNFPCTICNRSFVSENKLTNHLKVHSVGRPFKCDQCECSYSSNATLNRHKLIHDPSRRSICSYCEKVFSTSSQLDVHLRKHTGERPYTCNICNKSFTQSNTLKRHAQNHERDAGENGPLKKKIKLERAASLGNSNSNAELSSPSNDKDSKSNSNSLFANILNDPSLNNNLQQPD